jgi:hypothetical protein
MAAAHPLNITRIAFGCADFDDLRTRLDARAKDGEVTITTRYKPRRADELVGGSLFWISKHRLGMRQRILGFAEAEDGHCVIRLDARLIPVHPVTRRAHQGWRYLAGADAPPDLADGVDPENQIPPALEAELTNLGLI